RSAARYAVSGNHPAHWHFVLHIPGHLVCGRRLSWSCEAGILTARSVSLHLVFSAARRRTDRARLGLPAAAVETTATHSRRRGLWLPSDLDRHAKEDSGGALSGGRPGRPGLRR